MKLMSIFLCMAALMSPVVTGVRVLLDPYNHSMSDTKCGVGVIENQDVMAFTGVVYLKDTDGAIEKHLELSAKPAGSDVFVKVCSSDFDAEGCGEANANRSGCFCTQNVHPLYFFAANITLNDSFSGGELRGSFGNSEERWAQHHDITQTLPSIYSSQPNVTLKIDGKEVALGESCLYEIQTGTTPKVVFCTIGLEPKILILMLNEAPMRRTYGGNCITDTVQKVKAGTNSFYTFKYIDGCSREKEYTCRITSPAIKRVVLNPVRSEESGTQCKKGVVNGERILFNGFVNVSGTSKALKKSFIVSMKQAKEGKFSKQCSVDVDKNGCHDTQSGPGCYCKQYTHPLYFFVVNKTAHAAYSQGQIRASWGRYRSTAQTLPHIYRAESTATLDVGETNVLLGKKCTISIFSGVATKLRFCTSELESPELSIEFGPAILKQSAGEKCLTHMIALRKDQMNRSFHFKFKDGCNRKGSYTCTIGNNQCTFPAQLDGIWLASSKGYVSFKSSKMIGFHPCLIKSQCDQNTSVNWTCVKKIDDGYYIRTEPWYEKRGKKDLQFRAHSCIYLNKVSSGKFTFYMGPKERAPKPYNDFVKVTLVDKYVQPTSVCNIKDEPHADRIGLLLYKAWERMSRSRVVCPSAIRKGVFSIEVSGGKSSCSTNMTNCHGASIFFPNLTCNPLANWNGIQAQTTLDCLHTAKDKKTEYVILRNFDLFLAGSPKATHFKCLALEQQGDKSTILASFGSRCDLLMDVKWKPNYFAIYQKSETCPNETAVGFMKQGDNNPIFVGASASAISAKLHYTVVAVSVILVIP